MIKKIATFFSSVIAIVLASPAFGQAAPDLSLKATATAGYETNPFQFASGDTESAKLQLTLQPEANFRMATGDLKLAARVARTEYENNRYIDPLTWGLSAATTQQISASVDANVLLRFNSSIPQSNGPNEDLTNGGGVDPGLDPSFEGRQTRRKSFNSSGGLNVRIDQRTRLSFAASASALRLSNSNRNGNNDSYDFRGSVSNQINSAISIGASLRYSRFTYSNANNRTSVVAPGATLSWKLDSRTILNLTAGTSLVNSRTILGQRKSSSIYADGSLCYRADMTTLCGTFGKYVEPTSFDGVRRTTRMGSNASIRLDRKTGVSGSVNYVRTNGASLGQRGRIEYVAFGSTINRELSRPIHVFASARFGDSFGQPFNRRANAAISVGLSYRLGS
jgi:hypothetical protein